jgi:hypothetical protein
MKCFDDVEFGIATLSSFEPLIDNLRKAIFALLFMKHSMIQGLESSQH